MPYYQLVADQLSDRKLSLLYQLQRLIHAAAGCYETRLPVSILWKELFAP